MSVFYLIVELLYSLKSLVESCDKVVTLPMKGKIESLNASVAAGILLYAMMDAK